MNLLLFILKRVRLMGKVYWTLNAKRSLENAPPSVAESV